MERIIWSNFYKEVEAIKEDLLKEPENFLSKDNPTDEDFDNYANELVYLYHQDELDNLDKRLNGRILVIADLGLWDGRRKGYKILGNNLNEILYSDTDYYKIGVKNKNIRAIASHHDGTNYYEFREIREDRNIENLTNDIYNNKEITRGRLNYYTKSIAPYIKEIYG